MTAPGLLWSTVEDSEIVEAWQAEECNEPYHAPSDDSFDDITLGDPMSFDGAAMIVNTRVPVFLIAEMCKEGVSLETILVYYPHLTEGQVNSAIGFADLYRQTVALDRANYDATAREFGGV